MAFEVQPFRAIADRAGVSHEELSWWVVKVFVEGVLNRRVPPSLERIGSYFDVGWK